MKTLKSKYNERAIEKGLESLIQEHEQKVNELRTAAAAAKETSSNTQTETPAQEAEQTQTQEESK